MEHPAQKLGMWLKERRKATSLVLRVFAGRIHLTPSQYAEVEAGIVQWLGKEQEALIVETLCLDEKESAKFSELLAKARKASPLRFQDVFTPEQLEPLRTRYNNQKRVTEEARHALLDAVFKPLS